MSLVILLRVAQQVVLVPILISGWGVRLYEDWIVLFSAVSMLTMIDLGMQIYFGNAMLIAWSRGNLAEYRRHFAVAMGFYASVLVATAAVLAAIAIPLANHLFAQLHVMTGASAMWTAVVLAASTLGLVPFGMLTAVYRAHGDYSRGATIGIVTESLRGLGVCTVALLGGSPLAAALVYLSMAALSWAAVVFDQRRTYRERLLSVTLPTRSEAIETVHRSSLYMAPTLATPIVINGPVLLMGFLQSAPGAVVAFTITRTLTGFMRQIVSQFSHPIGAELSRLEASGERAKMRRLFGAAGRFVSGAAGLLGGFILVAGAPFIRLWTHGEIDSEGPLLVIFVVTIILMAPAQVALMMFQYNNRPTVLAVSHGLYAAGTVLLCVLLVGRFSALGAALSVGIAECLSVGFLLPFAASRDMSVRMGGYYGLSYFVAIVALAVGYGAAWALARMVSAESVVGFLTLGALWSLAVAPAALFLIVGKEERAWFLRRLRSRLAPQEVA